MNNEISFAPLIPLIGGFPLGAEVALGKPPKAIYSYKGFDSNDSHYVNYQQNTLNRNIEYKDISVSDDHDSVDIVVCTPPCAGLSSFNASKNPESRGAGCAKNDWMYISITDAIEKLSAKVVLVENAPALYTKKGEPVASKIYEIAKEHGYSLTLYKTSTMFHGIPQNRKRTFAILWKSSVSPYIEYYNRDRLEFDEFVNNYKTNTINLDHISDSILEDPFYKFVKHKFPNNDIRSLLKGIKKQSVFEFVKYHNLLDESIDYFIAHDNKKGEKLATHAKNKLMDGGNVWDGTVNVYGDTIGALTGRNMSSTLHPSEDRSLTIGEALHIMGFPNDFELLGGRKNMNHIAQNVPVCTARDMVLQAEKFVNGELQLSESDFIKQNNWKQQIDYESESHKEEITLF